jgi:flagellar hook-basal body complex protein FliE
MKPIDSTSLMAMRKAIISQNDALQKAVAAKAPTNEGAKPEAFGSAMTTALSQVNELQHQAGDISQSYIKGQTTDIAAVMMAKQKAALGFEATLQVRNKLLNAYQDIMNMPV